MYSGFKNGDNIRTEETVSIVTATVEYVHHDIINQLFFSCC